MFSIRVVTLPLQITTKSLPRAQVEERYFTTLQASGGNAPLIWSMVSGSLPAGLSLTSDGTISGRPTEVEGAAGTYHFTVKVTDSSERPQTVMRAYALVVLEDDETGGPED